MERSIYFCVRVQHYSAPGINYITHSILISWQPKRVMPTRPAAWHTAYAIRGARATHSGSTSCRKPDISQIWMAKQKAPSMQEHLQKLSLSTPSSVALLLNRLVIWHVYTRHTSCVCTHAHTYIGIHGIHTCIYTHILSFLWLSFTTLDLCKWPVHHVYKASYVLWFFFSCYLDGFLNSALTAFSELCWWLGACFNKIWAETWVWST